MKKLICFFAFMLLLAPFALSLEIDSKDSYNIGETALIKISGNFVLPILDENVFLYRGNAKSAADISVTKIEDEYYISVSLLDKSQGSYSLRINGAEYMDGKSIIKDQIIIPFNISSIKADFSITPGAIITEQDFSVSILNLQAGKIFLAITGWDSTNLFPESSSFEIKSGETKNIKFTTNRQKIATLSKLQFSSNNYSYYLPIYILAKDPTPIEEGVREYVFDPSNLNINISTDTNKTYVTYLKNIGGQDLENISLEFSEELKPYFSLSVNSTSDLEKNSSMKVEIYVSSPNKEVSIQGRLKAKAEPILYSYLSINFNTISSYIPLDDVPKEKENTTLIDDSKKDYSPSFSSKVIGWIIIIALLAFIGWFFFKKYSRAGSFKIDLLKVARGKEEPEGKEIILNNSRKI